MGASLAVHVGDGFCFVRAPPVGDGLQGEAEGVFHAHRPRGGLPQKSIAHGVGSYKKAADGPNGGGLRSGSDGTIRSCKTTPPRLPSKRSALRKRR